MKWLIISYALTSVAIFVGTIVMLVHMEPLQPTEPGSLYGFLYQELALIAATLLGTLVFVFSWLAVGRAPKRGDILLEFEPPNGLGPAALRFVHERCFDPLCATAAVIGMAVKGALRIVQEPVSGSSSMLSFRLEPTGAAGKGLTSAEQATYDVLFPCDAPLPLQDNKSEGARMDQARATLEAELRKEHDGTTFRWNVRYSIAAASVGIVGAFVLLLIANQSVNYPFFLSLGLTFGQLKQWFLALIASAIVTFFYAAPWLLPQISRIKPRNLLKHFGEATVLTTIVLAIAYWLIDRVAYDENYANDWILLGSGAFFGAVVTIFSRLMGATTKSGQRLMGRIRGFGLYLEGKEEAPVSLPGRPEATAALFERLLPYAAALGLTKEWSQQFTGIVEPSWTPAWYPNSGPFDAANTVKRLNSAIAATSEHAAAARGRRQRFVQLFSGPKLQPRH